MNKNRTIGTILEPQLVLEGAGVLLRRSFSPQVSNLYDPFLLFDHFAFNDPREGPLRGFPMHPHRGIETVTYILAGSVHHQDSLGNSGLIGPGDVQWMTAGGGILHEEMPQRDPDGNIYGFQLWVNLPATQKMSKPRYQEIHSGSIPIANLDGGMIRVVAGEISGIHGPVVEIAANPLYMDVTLSPGGRFSMPVPAGLTTLAYVFEGHGSFGGQEIESVKMVTFGDGDWLEVVAGGKGVRYMLIAGAPFREPIMPYGPFVMNTRQEIQTALEDLRNGTFVKN